MSVEQWQETHYEKLVNGEIQYGWHPRFVGQLVRNARQPRMREFVPEDFQDHFASQRSVNRWISEGFDRSEPMIAWVADCSLKLAGIAWITTDDEFGVRVYEGYQRERVGTRLAEAIHGKFDEKFPGRKTHFTMQTRNTPAYLIGSVGLGYQLQDTPVAREILPTSKILTSNLEQEYIRELPKF